MDVIKIGGADGVDIEAVCADLAQLSREGRRFVVVHGGSGDTSRLGEALGHPPRFVTSTSGHQSRVTDEKTLDIFLMATALLNRRIVSALQARTASAAATTAAQASRSCARGVTSRYSASPWSR